MNRVRKQIGKREAFVKTREIIITVKRQNRRAVKK